MYVPPPPPPISSSSEAPPPGCLAYGLFVLAILWICAVLGLGAVGVNAARDILMISGIEWPFWAHPLVVIVMALLVLLPAGLLFAFTPPGHLRSAYLAWLIAAGFLAFYGLSGAFPTGWEQAAQLVQAAVGLVAGLILALRARRSNRWGEPTPWWALLGGAMFAPLVLLPWFWRGALGSPIDTVLALAVGVGIGLVVALILSSALLPLLNTDRRPARVVGFSGLVLSVALLILAAGAGFESISLLLLAALPPLGFGAAALTQPFAARRRAWLAAAAFVGLAASGVIALFDPSEITLILGGSDIPTQANQAAGWGFLASLAVSLLLWAVYAGLGQLARPVAVGGVLATMAAAGVIYGLAGHPGFYGEKLFVIMRDQADLRGAQEIDDRDERLDFVYRELAEHALRTQSQLHTDLDRFGIDYTSYYLVNALEVDGGPFVRLWLSTRPEVDRVLESPQLRPLPMPPPPEPGIEQAPDGTLWNISSIGAEQVWREFGITGEGIVIGQSDSGVDGEHPALQASYRGVESGDTYNWIDPWYGSAAPRDYGSHGTHTLGSILGADGIGVAPGATWIACSNLARNLGNPAYYLDCMQFMLAPYAPGSDPLRDGRPELAAHVLNNSWGCPPIEGCDPSSLEAAVDALRMAGIFVVASAGNEGSACSSIDSPIALYDNVFTVGAIDRSGTVTDFSSRGPVTADGSNRTKPDIVAPGANILSAQPGGSYGFADGTSMAGPHVAGVVALVWAANPDLIGDIAQTEAILRETAAPYQGEPVESCGGGEASNAYGYGVVDAYAAVEAALALRN